MRDRRGRSEANATERGYRSSSPARPAIALSASAYLSSLTLRRGRSANHQMLTMVTTTPKAAAGLAIFRFGTETTLPGPVTGSQVRTWLPRESGQAARPPSFR